MADQYISKIGNLYVVSVCYRSETVELVSASFGSPTGMWEVVWNLMTIGGGEQAVFNEKPIECLPSGACGFENVRRLSPTQCAAVLQGKTAILQPVHYLIRVDAAKTTLVHDPTIVVSPDPVEIP